MMLKRQKNFLLFLTIIISLLATHPLLAASPEDNTGWSDVNSDEHAWEDSDWDSEEEESPLEINHTLWAGAGWFLDDQPLIEDNNALLEARYRLDVSGYYQSIQGVLKAEIIADDVADDIDIESREAFLSFSPVSKIDIRAGRQILTWGTGDLVFLNDLFPKDWQSFFSGREVEYLKAPSDAIKISGYTNLINLDIVWSPEFDSDNFLTGERFSFFNPMAGQIIAAPPKLHPEKPGSNLSDSETAVRLYRNIGSSEWALYGYNGFNKQPRAFNPLTGNLFFPEWQVFGASTRSPFAGGIGNIEFAWHRSMDDKKGVDPFIPNGEIRFLIGYEKEIISKLNVGMQYYLERIQDHDNLIASSLAPQFEPEESRHLLTLRVNYRARQDKLTWSLFSFYSPTDDDYYLIPSVTYRLSDLLTVEGGANVFKGNANYTFFAQLEDNSNVYTRVKFSF